MFTKTTQQRQIVALTIFGLGVTLTPASANHSWNGYHWARQANPFTVYVGDNLANDWKPYLGTAANDWNASTVLDMGVAPGNSSNPRRCRPTAGRVEVCNADYGNNGWLGVAQIWVSGSHITQGTVKLNDTYFKTAAYNYWYWKQMVACQEVGHTLGLDHQDETFGNTNLGTCMDYTNNPLGPPPNVDPNKHDYDELVTIYAHLDSTTTVGNSAAAQNQPPAMSQIDVDGPGQWGRLVASKNGGLTQIYELDFGGGDKLVTFVTWAERGNSGR